MTTPNTFQLKKITTFVFDVDGVLTDGSVFTFDSGEQTRPFNIKDGLAIVKALEQGYNIIVISGGKSVSTQKRLESLGIKDIYLSVADKSIVYEKVCREKNIKPEEILYMGDDIPDLKVMNMSGIAACPADAAQDILNISQLISTKNGGQGAVREVVEMVMRTQFKWKIV